MQMDSLGLSNSLLLHHVDTNTYTLWLLWLYKEGTASPAARMLSAHTRHIRIHGHRQCKQHHAVSLREIKSNAAASRLAILA